MGQCHTVLPKDNPHTEGTLLKAKVTAILKVRLRNTVDIPHRREATVLHLSNTSEALNKVDGGLHKDHLQDNSVAHHLIKAAMAVRLQEASRHNNTINMALLPLNPPPATSQAQRLKVMHRGTLMRSAMR